MCEKQSNFAGATGFPNTLTHLPVHRLRYPRSRNPRRHKPLPNRIDAFVLRRKELHHLVGGKMPPIIRRRRTRSGSPIPHLSKTNSSSNLRPALALQFKTYISISSSCPRSRFDCWSPILTGSTAVESASSLRTHPSVCRGPRRSWTACDAGTLLGARRGCNSGGGAAAVAAGPKMAKAAAATRMPGKRMVVVVVVRPAAAGPRY